MGNLFSSGKFDTCEVTISYRKYKSIAKHINWLCTWLSPIWPWCGFLHGDSFSNGSWQKQRIMDPKVKQITLWNQAIKCKLFWSYKNWYRNDGLPSISSWSLCILQKRISYFNVFWWLCNSLTQKIDHHIINWITKKWSWKLCVDIWRVYI